MRPQPYLNESGDICGQDGTNLCSIGSVARYKLTSHKAHHHRAMK